MSEVARIESEELHQYIDSIANSIANKHRDNKELVIVGIANGGIPFSINLARALEKSLGLTVALGSVDISFHRDDLGHKPITSIDNPTVLPVNIEDATVILADDVIFSGRTARAALNEIFDQGRPGIIELAVLCDRGNRGLPIQPNYIGFSKETTINQRVVVKMNINDPSNDSLVILNA
jgi:pyrimidine operon attenuation protein/uracil phosphoribosyltransferase